MRSTSHELSRIGAPSPDRDALASVDISHVDSSARVVSELTLSAAKIKIVDYVRGKLPPAVIQ